MNKQERSNEEMEIKQLYEHYKDLAELYKSTFIMTAFC